MTKAKVEVLLVMKDEGTGLMAGVMYGRGLRLMECVRLRVKDVAFAESADVSSRLAMARRYPVAGKEWRWQNVFS